MTHARRLLAIAALLAVVAFMSSPPSSGEPAGKKVKSDPVRADVPDNPEAKLAAAKFAGGGVITYQTLQGENLFAVQLQPKLPAAAARSRDYLIMISTAAGQAGEGWLAATQIAEAIIEEAKKNKDDRVSLWVCSTPEKTEPLTKDFLIPSVKEDARKLEKALHVLKTQHFPAGDTDLKNAMTQAVKTFDGSGERNHRIFLFLGDGQSTHNPITALDRQNIAGELVQRKVAFFPVPLGLRLSPENLHGFANATGGAVLRTKVLEEKLVDAMKRYQESFAGPILYGAKIKMPAVVTEFFPQELPPLRADQPTLVVGRTKELKDLKDFVYTLTGSVQERAVTVEAAEKIGPMDLDNFFLISMVNQWQRAKAQPALIRADRALVLAYEQTRLLHRDIMIGAQLAAENNELDAAGRLYKDALAMAPHDVDAKAGLKIIGDLKAGRLTREMIKDQLSKTKLDKMEKVNGVNRWTKTDYQLLAQLDPKNEPKDPKLAKPDVPDGADLIQAHRDRIIVEEQKMSQTVEANIRQARKDLENDPDAVLELLKTTLSRVKDHPDLTERVRDALTARLQTSLREIASQGRDLKIRQQQRVAAAAVAAAAAEKDQQRKTVQERVEAQFRVYKNLMNVARVEEKTKADLIAGLEAMQADARLKGEQPPQVAKAAYDQVLAAYNLRKQQDIRRLREERFLAVYLEIEKSHVPFPDEPGIYFPPLATWKAITDLRKEKYEVSSLPDEDAGRKEAMTIYKMLKENIQMKDFLAPMKLKEFLTLVSEKFAAKGKELPILVDVAALKEDAAELPDPYEADLKFQEIPKTMTMATLLRLALSQIPTNPPNNATYLIRRNYIEITTVQRQESERVLRVYPVGDLVMPISGGQMGMFGQMGGGQMGQFGGGQMGQFGGGQFGQFGGGQFGQFGGGQFGQFGGGQFGQFGGGQFGQFGGGQFGQFGGGQFGQFGGGQFGQFGQFGGGQFGMFGGGGQFMGGMGGGQAGFQGGSFQGGFNGSLGMMGASQAVGLIDVITKVVAPGKWFYTPQANPFAQQNNQFNPFFGGNMGMFGGGMMFGMMGGQFGNMGGNFGMMGGGAPPVPVGQGGPADLLDPTTNTIEFFPPALALIIRAPSRIHTSVTGGIIGGKTKRPDPVAFLNEEADRRGLDVFGVKGGIKIAKKEEPKNNQTPIAKINPKDQDLDPTKIWNEALAKSGVTPGLVIATADFLFEAGQYLHAAEFLKANLRYGIVVRPWVYEALAVALEASNGSPEEVRRARLSAVALDPTDAQGFIEAARTMAQHKQFDRALAFCRQAALLEPTLAQPYEEALAYAELGKDSKSMEWAVGKLLSQDWATDNQNLHLKAQSGLHKLAKTLQDNNRGTEADRLRQALQTLRQRDLVINLTWDSGAEPADLELEVKEPTGGVCSWQQKQTPGGGIFLPTDLLNMTKASYMAAQAFSGDYEVKVRRLFGQPLGGRARLEIVQHMGTPKETRRMEIIRLDQTATIKVPLANGRRTELANVAIAVPKRSEAKEEKGSSLSIIAKLRGFAHPDFSGATVRGSAGTPGANIPGYRGARRSGQSFQSAVNPVGGAGVNLTAEIQQSSSNQREPNVVLRPVFQTAGQRPTVNLSLIPGGTP